MYAPASSIRKSQLQKFVRKPTATRLGSEAAPWAKDSEYHLGGMTNTYRTGPKKGQETGTFSLLINPSAGQNKLMPQIMVPSSPSSLTRKPSLPNCVCPFLKLFWLCPTLGCVGCVLCPTQGPVSPKPRVPSAP